MTSLLTSNQGGTSPYSKSSHCELRIFTEVNRRSPRFLLTENVAFSFEIKLGGNPPLRGAFYPDGIWHRLELRAPSPKCYLVSLYRRVTDVHFLRGLGNINVENCILNEGGKVRRCVFQKLNLWGVIRGLSFITISWIPSPPLLFAIHLSPVHWCILLRSLLGPNVVWPSQG